MKNILVTGGAGFIGSHLCVSLANLGFNVTILDSLSPQIHGKDVNRNFLTNILKSNSRISFIEGSVTEKNICIKALQNQHALIHFAAETGTGQSMYEIKKYAEVNIVGTSLLLDLLANFDHGIKKIIVASSRAIYGEGKYKCKLHGNVYPDQRTERDMMNKDFECKCPMCWSLLELLPTDEESKIHPTSVYGITKQSQEQLVLLIGKSLGIPTVALRFQNVYGPGQSLSNPYTGVLSIFSTQIKNNNVLNIYEDGKEIRDFVYIDDAVNATILALTKIEADDEVFNVGSDERIEIGTVAALLRRNYNSDTRIQISGNYRIGDIRHNWADISKIKRILGYTPMFSFKEGLRNFCNWVEGQEVEEDNYAVSINELKTKGMYR